MEIQRVTIPEAVADSLLNRIANGEFQPGARLPPQRQLAAEMGIGMSSLREGLRSLAAAGILEVRPGKGTFVTDDLSAVAARQLGLGFKLEGRISRELLEVRRVLEMDAVAFAAERATGQEIDEIENLLAGMQEAVRHRNWPELERIDPHFHLAIVDASHNGILSGLVRSLYDLFQQMVMDTPFSRESFALHLDLYQALVDRNPDMARAAMSGILEHTRHSLQLADDGHERSRGPE